jgi:hypothetical protein
LRWAITIQNIQTDLGLQCCAFPTLGIEGDYIIAYSESKHMELVDLDAELSIKEWEKKRRAYIQKIVNGSMLSEQEKEWMEEYAPQLTTDITYNDNENRYVERITIPNLFDMRVLKMTLGNLLMRMFDDRNLLILVHRCDKGH